MIFTNALRSALAAVLLCVLCVASNASDAQALDPKAVVTTYADVAHAMYEDSVITARQLSKAVEALLADPSELNLKAARDAWIAARVPYQQTEGFRFGNKIVDDWEGRVNTWPLDEGLIDYVDATTYGTSSDENPLYTANIIASMKVRIGKEEIDVARITKEVLAGKLHEAQGVEANVATGYHAIEFLLWGQDLNGTGPGAGNRPAIDFSLNNCTNGHCDRRRDYLQAVTALLLDDLEEMAEAWSAAGAARKAILEKSPERGLETILTGLGSLSYGELAGERMKLGLMLHDPEEEHDCFSDNTHNAHYYNQIGMASIYYGHYTRLDGRLVQGASVAAYTAAKDAAAATAMDTAIAAATASLRAIKNRADSGAEAYDQMIAEGNATGNALVQAGVDALIAQARAIERVVASLGLKISFEGSDSLDNPPAVHKR